MKTFHSIRLLSMLLLLTLTGMQVSYATEIDYMLGQTKVRLSSTPGKSSLFVDIQQLGSEPVFVTFTDASGSVIQSRTVAGTSQFSRLFDLSKLPAGKYNISVSKTLMERIQPFALSAAGIELDSKAAFDKFFPMVQAREGNLDINHLLAGPGLVKVNILDAAGDKIFTENVTSTGVLNRRYDITALRTGKYTVDIQSEGNVFQSAFSVE